MLKKMSLLIVLCFAALSFAQVKPSFQAFDADYLKLSEAENGYHHFSIKVDYAPWAFTAEGSVKAPQGDPDLLFNSIDGDQLYIVVAYAPAPIGGSDGLEYQAGIYDIMIYYSDGADEFPTKIKGLKVSLLAPIANDSWAKESLADAEGKRGQGGSVFKDPENADALFKASAAPLSREQAMAAKQAATERKSNAIKARRDSIKAAEAAELQAKQERKMATVNAKKARQDSIAAAKANSRKAARQTPAAAAAPAAARPAAARPTTVADDDANLSPRERRRRALAAEQAAQKNTTTVTAPASRNTYSAPAAKAASAPAATKASASACDDPSLTPLQQKRCRLQNK